MDIQNTAGAVISSIDRIKQNTPVFEHVVDSFRDLLVQQAYLRAELPLFRLPSSFKPDPIRFSGGLSLLMQENLIRAEGYGQTAANCLFPAMERGFPKIASELHVLKTAMTKGQFAPERIMQAILSGDEHAVSETAALLNTAPELLKFVAVSMMKPFMEKLAEASAPLIEGLQWHNGNCPVCGAYPELSFLKTNAGQRWLRCSVCAHSWRFIRTQCPMCDNSDQDKIEAVFIEDMPHGRAELCHRCMHYIVTIDLRKYPEPVVSDTTVFGLLYLDVIAQGQGYAPMAASAWNVIN